jgi:SulP family sulfate permease
MSDVPHFMYMTKHAPSHDRFVLFATFLLTIFTNLVVAVNIGVILAMLFFIRRMIQFTAIEQLNHESLTSELLNSGVSLPKDTLVYVIQGPFFFGVAEKMERAFAITHSDPKNIIFRLNDVPFMDITGLQTFSEIIEQFHNRGVTVFLCGATPKVAEKITNIGITRWIGANRIFDTLIEVVKHLL